jgi:hypothetical protein
MREEYAGYEENPLQGFRNAHDQNFLADVLYNRVLPILLIHYGKAPIFDGEVHTVQFPFAWTNSVYCGRVENDYIDFDQPQIRRTAFALPSAQLRMEKPGVNSPPLPVVHTAPPTSFIPRPPGQPGLFLTRK